ncbi:MAG TPA: PfkB family carbohydrate kinase [Miltoncostaeaceae bacterium]|nr:PfkB family carbohydrate kinase [Miltoncostaeaceae bacterium]
MSVPTVAVVGHVEWVTHAVGELPHRGQIVRLSDAFDEPGGGGGVAVFQVAKLGARAQFFTALATDATADATGECLAAEGVETLAGERPGIQTRGLAITDSTHERTIILTGERLSPRIDDPLPWERLARADGAYFTGDDPRTLIAARAARHLVVTARRLDALIESRVEVDVLVASAADTDEAVDVEALPVAPRAIVWTQGGRGGHYLTVSGHAGRFEAAPLPGPPVDSYGCGDSFQAGLTVGLARGLGLEQALALGARCGAAVLTGRGGLATQLRE